MFDFTFSGCQFVFLWAEPAIMGKTDIKAVLFDHDDTLVATILLQAIPRPLRLCEF
jgi:hypothetical protein